jgi:TonB family protein
MSFLKLFAITKVLCVLMAGAPQIDSFEKQALSLVRSMPASDLDAKLPGRSFGSWLEELIGAKAGMVWQLTECGKQIPSNYERIGDLPACAEITALLPDKRRVFITISVGTFKEGLTGKPTFFSAVIEQNAELYSVRQLYDLTEKLRAANSVSGGLLNKRSATKRKNRIVNPPEIKSAHVMLVTLSQYPLAAPSNFPGAPGLEELTPPPLPQELESMLQSRAINRVNPVYPPNARKMNATGTVQVEVTISESGVVVDAKAISGHIALRNAAVEAALKWVFKPAIFNDAPVKIKGVLTFTFGPGAK